jgi:hypothetical protein
MKSRSNNKRYDVFVIGTRLIRFDALKLEITLNVNGFTNKNF